MSHTSRLLFDMCQFLSTVEYICVCWTLPCLWLLQWYTQLTSGNPGDPHSATHYTLTWDINLQFRRRLSWSRSKCITIARLTTGRIRSWPSIFTVSDNVSPWSIFTMQATTRQRSSSSLSVPHVGSHLYELHQLNWPSVHLVLSGIDREWVDRAMTLPLTENERERLCSFNTIPWWLTHQQVSWCKVAWTYTTSTAATTLTVRCWHQFHWSR